MSYILAIKGSETMTEQFYEVQIETFCWFKNGQVVLTLRSDKLQLGELVSGKPVWCNFQTVCKATENAKCFLHSLNIETRRR